MAREPRLEYPGAVYHVTVRVSGCAWEKEGEPDPSAFLFRDASERERFLNQLGERVDDYAIRGHGRRYRPASALS